MLAILAIVLVVSGVLIVAGFTAPVCRKVFLFAGIAIPAYIVSLFLWFGIIYSRYVSIEMPTAVGGGMYFFLPPLIPVALILLIANKVFPSNR